MKAFTGKDNPKGFLNVLYCFKATGKMTQKEN